MERKDCIIGQGKYTHLAERDRYKIEVLLEGRKSAKDIAILLRRDRSTIYREIKRGSISRVRWDLSERKQYRANVAQADYVRCGRNKERSLKIGKDRRLEEYIRIKLLGERYSPDAIIGQIRSKMMYFEGMICTKTLYNYIDAGYFSGISNKNLWEKRKRRRRSYKTVVRVTTRNRRCRSIEQRPCRINDRVEYGHWEGDTVKGPIRAKVSLFTLTERASREQIIIKIEQATQEGIKAALDRLEKRYGVDFKIKFKSITFDNGTEFLNWESLELSSIRPTERRTTIYFAHSYSAWERGTNENQNRMIRRFIPKGTDIADLTDSEINGVQEWLNNYPRRILGYRTANEATKAFLQGNSDLKLKSVAL